MPSKTKTKDNNLFYFTICLFFLLIINISVFFFFKNTTYQLSKQNTQLDKDIIEEQRRLALSQANFNKKYNINSLQELSKKYLNLQFSNVKQIKEFTDILK